MDEMEVKEEWVLVVKSEGLPAGTAYLCGSDGKVFTKSSQDEVVNMAVEAMKFGNLFVEINDMIFIVPVNKVLWTSPYQIG